MGWNDHLDDPNSYAEYFPHLHRGLGSAPRHDADIAAECDVDAQADADAINPNAKT